MEKDSVSNGKSFEKLIETKRIDEGDENISPVTIHILIESISNIPRSENGETFILELQHKNKILEPIDSTGEIHEPFPNNSSANGVEKISSPEEISDVVPLNFNYNLIVQPDSIEELNNLIDYPLFIVLKKFSNKVDVESTSEQVINEKSEVLKENSSLMLIYENESTKIRQKRPTLKNKISSSYSPVEVSLGFGHLSLIQLITSSSKYFSERINLYPEQISLENRTFAIDIKIHTDENLINSGRELVNLLTITLESIFNIPENLKQSDQVISVDFYMGNEISGETNKKLFNFSHGKLKKFSEIGNFYKRWNNLPNVNGLGTQTNVKAQNSFKGIYDFNTQAVTDMNEDSDIYAFNSIHYFLISEKFRLEFIEFLRQNETQFLVEVNFQLGVKKKMIGCADLSPLLYPEVKNGRFFVPLIASNLTEPKEIGKRKKDLKTKLKEKNVEMKSSETTIEQEPKSTFLTFEIELQYPLTKLRNIKKDSSFIASDYKKGNKDKDNWSKIKQNIENDLDDEIVNIIKNLHSSMSACECLSESGDVDIETFKGTAYHEELQMNLKEKIMKLVAVKYNPETKKISLSKFLNLMADLYNSIIERVEDLINEAFAGAISIVEIKFNNKFEDIEIIIAKECDYVGFGVITEYIYDNLLKKEKMSEETVLHIVVHNLEKLDFKKAWENIENTLNTNSTNCAALLIHGYLLYLKNDTNTFMDVLLKGVKRFPNCIELWVLLYVIHKNANYRPGFKHSKMKYLLLNNNYELSRIWTSLEIFFHLDPNDDPLCQTVNALLKLRLFKFAELVLEHCQQGFTRERHITIQFMIYFYQKDYEAAQELINKGNLSIQVNFMVNSIFKLVARKVSTTFRSFFINN